MKEKEIPEQCKTCKYMKKWLLPVDGTPEYSCLGGRNPAMMLYCNRYEEGDNKDEENRL